MTKKSPAKATLPDDNPTPAQRADFLVRRLEELIREGKTASGGMSFRNWQQMARAEIANGIRDAEQKRIKDDKFLNRLVLCGAGSVVTIGFWGAVVAMDRSYGRLAAGIMLGALGLLAAVLGEWYLRHLAKKHKAKRREEILFKIEDFDKQIRAYERARKKKLEKVKDEFEEAG